MIRLLKIKLSGFRGVLDPVEIDFGTSGRSFAIWDPEDNEMIHSQSERRVWGAPFVVFTGWPHAVES